MPDLADRLPERTSETFHQAIGREACGSDADRHRPSTAEVRRTRASHPYYQSALVFLGLREYLSNATSRGQRIVGLVFQRSISRELLGALLTQFNPIYQASVSIPTLPFVRHRGSFPPASRKFETYRSSVMRRSSSSLTSLCNNKYVRQAEALAASAARLAIAILPWFRWDMMKAHGLFRAELGEQHPAQRSSLQAASLKAETAAFGYPSRALMEQRANAPLASHRRLTADDGLTSTTPPIDNCSRGSKPRNLDGW